MYSCKCGRERNCCNRVIWKPSSHNKVPGCTSSPPSCYILPLLHRLFSSHDVANRNGHGSQQRVLGSREKCLRYSQSLRLKSLGARADHSLMVFTVLFMYPGMGVSYGIASTTCNSGEKCGRTGLGVKGDPGNWRTISKTKKGVRRNSI